MSGRLMWLAAFLCWLDAAAISVADADDVPTSAMVTVTRAATAEDVPQTLTGRVLVQAVDGGLLLEDRSGRLHQLSSAHVRQVAALDQPFTYLSTDELAHGLLQQTGPGFAIHPTEHFLICSDASTLYTEFCGRLLEKVWTEFHRLFADLPVRPQPLNAKLLVLVFREPAVFQAFAKAQHPDTDFTDVPGYYSVRDNQMLITAVSGDRDFRSNSDVLRELRKRPRQVETIVHEAVHQLAFNTGLQVRYADNSIWLSEGLAVYFETASGRGSLVWSRPGDVNRIHLPGFRRAVQGDRLRLPLTELVSSDAAFSTPDRLADAYAESWALTWYLLKYQPDAFGQLIRQQQSRKPLVTVSPADRLQELKQITGQSPAELEPLLIERMSRLRD